MNQFNLRQIVQESGRGWHGIRGIITGICRKKGKWLYDVRWVSGISTVEQEGSIYAVQTSTH